MSARLGGRQQLYRVLRWSEVQAHRELYQSRKIQLRADDAELRVPHDLSWRSELHTVENVEKLGAELQREPFCDSRVLENREIIVRNSRCANSGKRAAEISERSGRWS